ncbi:secretin N-terminal domain-containing protein [Chitinimonas sp. BJYL2]|uniref:secretin N-terminal domain-containing protein n=1 Tax=Chitinimonas sp. BJYL2 TaxID=2976696 RepID=UPI0022B5E1D0|nr:secretin N-terminal domain-containing protein [Chitinimonas sp. BJYL2]
MKRRLSQSLLIVLPLLLAACASDRHVREGESMIQRGDVDAGLRYLLDQSRQHPQDVALRSASRRQLDVRLEELFRNGEAASRRGDYDGAQAAYAAMLGWDANNERAQVALAALGKQRRTDSILAFAHKVKDDKPDDALAAVRQILAENPHHGLALKLRDELESRKSRQDSIRPKLAKALQQPVSLQFRDQPITYVLDLISRIGKINFVLDKDVPAGLRTTLYVQDGSIEDVLNLMLVTNQLDRKVLSENSLLIYPKRPDKEKDYKDLVMRTFYLDNADPKQILAMLKMMVKTRDMYIDERLNLLVMRDTPEVIEVAERLVAAQDLPQSEVMLDLEVLEISRSDLLDLGIRYPDSVSATIIGSAADAARNTGNGVAGVIKLSELENLNRNNVQVGVGNPTALINLLHRRGNTNLLANPQIRIKNRDKAKVHIGEKVPVVTTVNANGVVSESISLLEVGLSLEAEPAINLNDEVSIKLNLEVSSIIDQLTTKTGLVAYKLGSRKANTSLTLRDGETQMLAGLINRTEQDQRNGIPVLGDLPLLDRLFGSRRTNGEKTEVVLLVTPRIVRNLPLPAPYITQFDSGTEGAISTEPLRLRPAPVLIAPPAGQDMAPPVAAPAQPNSPDTPIGAGRRG